MSKLSSEELEFQQKFEKRIICDSEHQTKPEKVGYSFALKELLEQHYDFYLEGTITTAYPMKQERMMESRQKWSNTDGDKRHLFVPRARH